MKTKLLITAFLASITFSSCDTKVKDKVETVKPKEKEVMVFKNKGHELVYEMVQKVGDYKKLSDRKDVVYTYTYQTPDGKTDISTEKYIFNGELSYGKYDKHERVFADLEGTIEQSYDGKEFWLKHKGEVIEDEKRIKRVVFNRPTNFYWFAMLPKLLDPGLNYEYVESTKEEDKNYNIVKISFSSNEKPADIYQVYINKETKLMDHFLFTVAEFGIVEKPLLMKVAYEDVDGLLIPTKRQYKKVESWSTLDNGSPWINVNWTNIKFNNNLKPEDFKK